MNLRPKTIQRLLVLLAITCVIGVVTGIVVTIQLRRFEEKQQQIRAAGMDAYNRRDYRAAADNLTKYLSDRFDSDAVFALAVSETKLPRPDLGNLLEARGQFARYLQTNSNSLPAKHQLLEIYQKLHYTSETATLADDILQQDPNDVPALSARLGQLLRDMKYPLALPVAMRLNELAPDDLSAQETTYFLMSNLGKAPSELTDRADAALAAHPNDSRYEMLRAVAAYFSNDLPGAKKWLQRAAARAPADPQLTTMLVTDFDRMSMWSDSLDLLKRVDADPAAPVSVRAMLVQRLWEFHQNDAAMAQLKGLGTAADSQLIGLHALVSFTESALSEAVKNDVKILSSRADDMVAMGWATLITALANERAIDTSAAPALAQFVNAERNDPDNPDARFYLAMAYQRLGEGELALQCLGQTSQMQPEWPQPYIETAKILLDRGQAFDAIAPAQSACERDPSNRDAQALLAEAQYQQLGPGAQPSAVKAALDRIEQVLKSNPRDATLIADEVDLLARSDRKSEAVETALSAGSDAQPASAHLLRLLSVVDKQNHLQIADQLVDQLGRLKLSTPMEVSDAFEVAANARSTDLALKLMDRLGRENTPAWRLAWLQACDSNGDPTQAGSWETFVDAHPDRLDVLHAALRSPGVLANRALADRTIDRLKAITGEPGIEWKLARARWLLAADEDKKTHANAAAELIAEVVKACPNYAQPRLIWADALATGGDFNGAIACLQIAHQLEPQDPGISIRLATLMIHEGQMQPAGAQLDSIENNPHATKAQLVESAELYRQLGSNRRAIQLLTDPQFNTGDDAARDMLLARLLAEHGELQSASAIYDRWIAPGAATQHAPAAVVRAAAWFNASHGAVEPARKRLSDLTAAQISAFGKELLLGDFESRFGTISAAASHYGNAAKLASNQPDAWLHWAGAMLKARDFTSAAKLARQGLKLNPKNAGLLAMKDHANGLGTLKLAGEGQSQIHPLIEALANDPTDEAATATLNALIDSQTAHEDAGALAERLRSLTEQYPKFIPLLDLLVPLDCHGGRYTQALAAVTRARQMAPAEIDPARQLYVITSTAGQWEKALSAASEWRGRSLEFPQSADIAIATAQIQLDRPANAIDQLSLDLSAPNPDPAQRDDMIALTAQALCMQNEPQRAWKLVHPLVIASAGWRQRWLQIVSTSVRDSVSVADCIEQTAAAVPAAATTGASLGTMPVANSSASSSANSGVISEQLALGRAWFTAGVRLDDADLLHKAESIAQSLTDASTAPADAWLLLGSVQLQLQNLSDAETSLKKAQALSPDSLATKVELARVKLQQNQDLATAKKLASDAVAAEPANGDDHTLLGQIDQQMNDLDAALTEYDTALKLDPKNAQALISLASAQNAAGQFSQARSTLGYVETLIRTEHPTLPANTRAEMQKLRDGGKKPAASAAVSPADRN
jgi:tetratricopeptide (TPR) repeat protein